MILQELNVSKYAQEYEGIIDRGAVQIEYRLNYPVYLALTGKTETLEALIREGMAPQGVTPEICCHLEHPMYLRIVEQETSGTVKTTPVGLVKKPYSVINTNSESQTSPIFTTAEAAVLGHQYETLQMLFAHGVCLDLRIYRTSDIFNHCSDENIIRCVKERPECYAEKPPEKKTS